MNQRSNLLIHPIFILSVFTLLIDDHFLKYEYHNFLTGKLSDFAGLIVLPIFIAFVFPKLSKVACLISALWFVFWKSPFSSGLIDLLNLIPNLHFMRVIDYSDLMALIILPIPMFLINQRRLVNAIYPVFRTFMFVGAFFALCSTSMIFPPCETPEGTILIDQSYTMKVPKDTILSRIKDYGYEWQEDFEYKTPFLGSGMTFPPDTIYVIENIVIPIEEKNYCGPTDTIQKLTFTIDDYYNKLTIKEVTFSDTLHLSDWRKMKKYSKLYWKITKDLFAKEAVKK